ncbi:transcription antitermination factor NusB [Butyricicoccus sp.]|uniref:transcription antitermination factor NusB n=1 Tax=Butyricicoccus sp. TaxID=2049021 RepID=UPI003D7D9EC9
MGRKEAREIALHLIFELSFKQFDDAELVSDRLEQEVMESLAGDVALYAGELPEEQKAYIRNTVLGVCAHCAELDAVVEAHSTNWKTNRLTHMTMSLLRLALYEMQYAEDVPVGTAIDEAVALAKKYESKEASAFVNGVLGAVAREKADEKAE